MIHFSDAPPADPRGYGLPLVRTPQSKPIIGALTCEKVLYCRTHFWGGRTVPHDEEECEPCKNGSAWRWHAYLAALDHRNHLHFLFETTSKAAEPFKDWQDAHGTLRGARFMATRPQRRVNGRVIIQIKSHDLIELPIPDPPNIQAALSIIWNIPLPDIFDGKPNQAYPVIGVERGTAEAAAALAAKLDVQRKPDVTMLATEAGIEADRAALIKRVKARRAKAEKAIAAKTPAAGDALPEPPAEEFQKVLSTAAGGNGRVRLAATPESHD